MDMKTNRHIRTFYKNFYQKNFKKDISNKKENFLKTAISFLPNIFAIILGTSSIAYYFVNAAYKLNKSRFFILPRDFFNADLSSLAILSVYCSYHL